MAIATKARTDKTKFETSTEDDQFIMVDEDFRIIAEGTVTEDDQFISDGTGAYDTVMRLLEDELRWPLKGLASIAKELAATDHQAQVAYAWLNEFLSYVDCTKTFLVSSDSDFAAIRDMYCLENYLCSIVEMADIIHDIIPTLNGLSKAKKKEYREDIRDVKRLINKGVARLRRDFPYVFDADSED